MATTKPAATIDEKLRNIQIKLKAPKNQYNKFGEYYYRSCEDILNALKPLLDEYGVALTMSDAVVQIGDRFYVKAMATIRDKGQEISVSAFAREQLEKKKSDASQITGAASSYARKYALNGLFAIDDSIDADSQGPASEQPQNPANGGSFVAHCINCGTAYTFDNQEHYQNFIKNPGCCGAPSWMID
ncbi:MAG: ERF family protein [Atopobium sp.]|uniref:ERF family protein n=1 Tax=Atopobium sp. TaxID=1872650 RepID=UPI002A81AED7|nr:ERF family protein [Atopobium sp.]MDY4523082.1 ERF family protein [Atopobium sp.]